MMRTPFHKKKILSVLGLLILAGLSWFIACRTDKNTIYIESGPSGPETLCDVVNNGESKCGSVSPYNAVILDEKTKSLTIKVSPNTNFRVGSWLLDNVKVQNSKDLTEYTLENISANHTVKVNFEPFYVTPITSEVFTCNEGGGPKWECTLNYTTDSNKLGFKLQFANNFIYGDDYDSCKDHVSILVTEDSNTFVPKGSINTPQSGQDTYKNQYFCQSSSSDNAIITLSGTQGASDFRPIAKNFTITINDNTFEVKVVPNFDPSITKLKLNDNGGDATTKISTTFKGCGQFGTIVQRMFDCSLLVAPNYQFTMPIASLKSLSKIRRTDNKRVKIGTADINYDGYWFIVSCPSGETTGNFSPTLQNCAWLTPVIDSENPAVHALNGGSTGLQLIDFAQSYSSGKPRLLFSGIIVRNNTENNRVLFTSREANGYDIDTLNDNDCTSSLCYKNTFDSRSNLFLWSYGKPTGNENLSLCGKTDIEILPILPNSDSTNNLAWQVPSYPMLYLITGDGECNSPEEDERFCSRSDYAFNAVDIAGFLRIRESGSLNGYLWSSSYLANAADKELRGMIFFKNGTTTVDAETSLTYPTRCASTQWN